MTQDSLTLRHIGPSGDIAYLAVTSIHFMRPPGQPSYLVVEVAGSKARREAHGGFADIINAAGRVIESIQLGTIMPVSEADIAPEPETDGE
jgi:hypothetical protein